VNSAYFGPATRVTSLRQAVSRLGVDLLKALALSIHAFDSLKVPPVSGFSIQALQHHSYATARMAKELHSNPAVAAESFAAALLHDVGKLVLALGIPERFGEIMAEHDRSRRPFHEIEQQMLGITHAEVGAYLLGSWGLPLTMVETVAYHHIPSSVPDSTGGVLAAVHLADALMDAEVYKTDDATRDGKLDLEFLEQTSRTDELPKLRELAARIHAELG
jgi:putative nucleotidyltransferase with HDIG domain